MRVQQNRNQNDRVAQQNRNQSLPPVHACTDQSRRKHVSRNAVRHADPERGVVVSGPIALVDFDGRQIAIEEGTATDLYERVGL